MAGDATSDRTMKKLLFLCFALIAWNTQTPVVAGEPGKDLTGTWMLDVTASQQSMLRARPFLNTEAFVTMPPMGLMFFKFDRDTLLTGSLPDVGDAVRFRRGGVSSGEMSYVSNHNSKDVTILVSGVNENNISIIYPEFPASRYFLWKRTTLDPNKKTPSDYRPEFDAYVAMLKNLWVAFGFPSDSPADINRGAR